MSGRTERTIGIIGRDYVLVLHVEQDDASTRTAVHGTVGSEQVRIAESGRFKKQ